MKISRYINLRGVMIGLLSIICLVSPMIVNAQQASELLSKCSAKLKAAKSLKCDFTMKANGNSLTGTLLSKGAKFSITVPGAGTWYNGKSIWSYNKAMGETTVWTPTRSDLMEANPLLYISTEKDYTVSEQGKSVNGVRTIVLTPKKRNAGVKKVSVGINTKTLLPVSVNVQSNGGSVAIAIKSIKLNPVLSDASFVYNPATYKGVPVTDLR